MKSIESCRYRQYLWDLRGRGNWLSVPLPWIRALYHDTALLVVFLLNTGQGNTKDGWIWAQPKFIRAGLGANFHSSMQRQLLQWLREQDIIKVKRTPSGRYVKFDLNALDLYIDAHGAFGDDE